MTGQGETTAVAERETGGLGPGARRVLGLPLRPFVWVANARGRWRFLLLLAECLAGLVCGALLWRGLGFRGLPEVGRPFDTEAFLAASIPPERNFYDLYRKAADLYRNGKRPPRQATPRGPGLKPRPDDPATAAWLDDNAEALALFYQAADRPDALPPRAWGNIPNRVWPMKNIWEVGWLAVEDAARAQAEGDPRAAWRSLRAVLRAAALIGRRGSLSDRQVAAALRGYARRTLLAWADDPATPPALIRQALDDVLALDALAPDDAEALRGEYLGFAAQFERTDRAYPHHQPIQVADMLLPEGLSRAIDVAHAFVYREPERSRRVARLAFANWIAWAELPPASRPRPAVKAVVVNYGMSQRVDFFDLPQGPPAARAVGPEALARAFLSAGIGRPRLGQTWNWLRGVRSQEARDRSEVILRLAGALYQRDKKALPPDPEALLGAYLKALPDDGAVELDDGTTPTVD